MCSQTPSTRVHRAGHADSTLKPAKYLGRNGIHACAYVQARRAGSQGLIRGRCPWHFVPSLPQDTRLLPVKFGPQVLYAVSSLSAQMSCVSLQTSSLPASMRLLTGSSLRVGCATAVACDADGGRRAARRPGGRVRVPACSGRAGGHLRRDQLHGGAALAAGARPPLPSPAGRRQPRRTRDAPWRAPDASTLPERSSQQ
jgi:hypothetical protein